MPIRKLSWTILLFAACATAAQAQTLRWAGRSDGRTMDPYGFLESVNHNLNALVYDALVERDRAQRIVPALAARWQQIDPLTWRFWMRPGLTFSDGSALTSDDVVFSIERAQQPPSAFATYSQPLGKAIAIDAGTIELRLPRPDPLLLDHVAMILVMSRQWAVAHRSEHVAPYAAREQAYLALHALGSGRYVLRERVPDTRTVFERNPRWWGRFEGNVQRIVYRPIQNDATRVAALIADDIDFAQDIGPQDLDRLSSLPALRISSVAEYRLIMFGFDQWRDELLYSSVRGANPFKDARVREAFARATDAASIKASIMRGRSIPTSCLAVDAAGCQASELDERDAVDLARARELMAQAGYADGFELRLDCPNDRYLNDRQICIALAGMLGRIGVRLKVDAQPKTLFFPRVNAGDTSFFMIGWSGSDPDPQPLFDALLHSRDAAQGKGAVNAGRIADPELDRLIDAAAIELDAAARSALIRAVQRRAHDRFYYLPLHRQVLSWVARTGVHPVMSADNLVHADWVRID